MNIFIRISFCVLLLSAVQTFSQAESTNAPAEAQQQTKGNAVHGAKLRDGQQVFEQNCSRCHNAPQGFSPRISGTVTKHMRVRAGLSSDDEKAILRFLNP
ncbi:c-type cytochrome [Tunturiibacter gelidoferens]|uniref:Cytochrome c5 n=1 Tax=Tunturiibacter gelidiferens TaxID=3069689 RepID=A0ACC5P404_9BACT|nr:cytochrome c [Edaphobacter lichenicola]MBB5341435.1 cytochrome c5 [Edaphobacter lichenicola]